MKRTVIILLALLCFGSASFAADGDGFTYNTSEGANFLLNDENYFDIDSIYLTDSSPIQNDPTCFDQLSVLVSFGRLTSIGMEKFEDPYNNRDFEHFPEYLREIPDGTFSRLRFGTIPGIHGLQYMTIPYCISRIGEKAFFGESALLHVDWCMSGALTEIDDFAFFRCWRLDMLNKFVLPDNLERIGTKAFYDNNFSEIVLPASLKSIGEDAFSREKGSSSISFSHGRIRRVTCLAKEPPEIEGNPFDGDNIDENGNEIKPILIVPKGCKRAYYTEKCPWRTIFAPNIYEIGEEPSAVDEVQVAPLTPTSGTVYDIQGRQVTEKQPGQVYIQDGKKVLVK